MKHITVKVRGRKLTVRRDWERCEWRARIPGSVKVLGGCDLFLSSWTHTSATVYSCSIESTEDASRHGALPTWVISCYGASYQDAVDNAVAQVAKLGQFFGGET